LIREATLFKLLKNGTCLTPDNIGIKDVLIVGSKIYKVEENIPENYLPETQVFDCSGKFILPGFIDQHVHITGGGGESGPETRIPELMLSSVISSGISTIVGVLGFDDIFRSPHELWAKAKALEHEGLNTYMYCGSYSIPAPTITGRIATDIALIDKVVGVGEIAISDYRSSYPSYEVLAGIAAEAMKGALLGRKAGVVHIHVGDGKVGISPLIELVKKSDYPMVMFVPTHLNRNKALFEQAIRYAKEGGNIDLTAGESSEVGYSVPDAMERLFKEGVDMGRVTVSSDGNGSVPAGGQNEIAVGRPVQLFEDIKKCITEKGLDMVSVIKTVTSNVANVLKIFPEKGAIRYKSDADILILNSNDFSIDKLIINGDLFMDNGNIVKKGVFDAKNTNVQMNK